MTFTDYLGITGNKFDVKLSTVRKKKITFFNEQKYEALQKIN